MPANCRMPVLPKNRAAADVIFPEPGLRFVNSQGSGAAQWRAVMFLRQALFVHAVTRFMKNPEKGLGKSLFVIPSCQAAISRAKRSRKWVCGRIDAPGLEIETDGLGHFAIQRLLSRDGEISLHQVRGNRRRALESWAEHRTDRRTKLGKQLAQLAGP